MSREFVDLCLEINFQNISTAVRIWHLKSLQNHNDYWERLAYWCRHVMVVKIKKNNWQVKKTTKVDWRERRWKDCFITIMCRINQGFWDNTSHRHGQEEDRDEQDINKKGHKKIVFPFYPCSVVCRWGFFFFFFFFVDFFKNCLFLYISYRSSTVVDFEKRHASTSCIIRKLLRWHIITWRFSFRMVWEFLTRMKISPLKGPALKIK